MVDLAVIGGSGFNQWGDLQIDSTDEISTPYGECSSSILTGCLSANPGLKQGQAVKSKKLAFLPRHGENHQLPPHRINYRANLWALKSLGVKYLLSVNAVGGIHPDMGPKHITIPHQLIDYSYGREHTFFDGRDVQGVDFDKPEKAEAGLNRHIDFSHPYDASLRRILINQLEALAFPYSDKGVYGCTQGPRLETAAEIKRLRNDGCDLVGMTGMPEAALARELGIRYASIAIVVNYAPGVTEENVCIVDIKNNLLDGMGRVKTLIQACLTDFENIE